MKHLFTLVSYITVGTSTLFFMLTPVIAAVTTQSPSYLLNYFWLVIPATYILEESQ